MSVIFLIILLLCLVLFISTLSGLVRFFIDTRKYSAYRDELEVLISKYNKLCPDFDDNENENKEVSDKDV